MKKTPTSPMPPAIQSDQPETSPDTKGKGKPLTIVFALLLLGTLGIAGYFAFQNYQLKQQASQPQLSLPSTATASPAPVTDPTTDWLTYTSKGLLFKYPPSWAVETSRIIGTNPDVIIYVAASDSTLMNECMKLDTTEERNGFVIKKFSRVTTGEMCSTDDSSSREIWVIPAEDDYSPGISYSYTAKDNPEAENIFNQILSTFKFTEPPTKTTQTNGAGLKDIKYEIPSHWEADLNDERLFLSPGNGGYLSVQVYDYPENIGRRTYYCQVRDVCIEKSYFTETNIGNISGYIANGLDNSGGGLEYFGAKGNKFYIISSYNPPSPNDFENHYKNVLDSLIF